jgi:hypothetical protein
MCESMILPRCRILAVCLFLCTAASAFAAQKECITADEASKHLNKEVCVTAHIYDIVELPNGTRFLDVCSPDTKDDLCRFTLVSYWEDHDEVGELRKYKDMDVHIRGIVRSMHGRAGIVLSHVRQFYGGPPKFKPNPLLARGFSADQQRPPISDPNLRRQGGGRGFMNNRNQTTRPTQ